MYYFQSSRHLPFMTSLIIIFYQEVFIFFFAVYSDPLAMHILYSRSNSMRGGLQCHCERIRAITNHKSDALRCRCCSHMKSLSCTPSFRGFIFYMLHKLTRSNFFMPAKLSNCQIYLWFSHYLSHYHNVKFSLFLKLSYKSR